MDVQVDKTGPCVAKVSVKVPSAELESEVQRALQNVGRRTRMKGFRPGKVPTHVLEKSFGADVRQETLQNYVRKAFEQAVQEQELRPAAHPQIGQDAMQVLVGSDFELDFEVLLRPDIQLGEYTGLEAKIPKIEADDEELDAALDDLKKRQSRPEVAEDGEGLEEEGMAVGKLELCLDDDVVESRDGMRLSPAHAPPGVDEEPYKAAMTGATKDATVEFPITYPEDFHHEEVRGKEGLCKFTLTEVYRVVPPTEEELLKFFEAEDAEGMRNTARERLLEAKSAQRDQMLEAQLLEQVMGMHQIDLPEPLIEQQVNARVERLTQELAAQGTPPEEAQAQVEAETESAYETTARSLQALYLVEAIGQKEELKVTEEDMVTELQEIAKRNGAGVDDVRRYYQEQNMFPQLATELLERKVRVFLRENANVTEE